MKTSCKQLLCAWTLFGAMILPAYGQAAQTQTDYNGMTIIGMGASTNGVAFFNVAEYPAENPAKGCVYGLYYVKLDTPGGRGVYAALMQANAMGKKLLRFDWNRIAESDGNVCYISLVIMKD